MLPKGDPRVDHAITFDPLLLSNWGSCLHRFVDHLSSIAEHQGSFLNVLASLMHIPTPL